MELEQKIKFQINNSSDFYCNNSPFAGSVRPIIDTNTNFIKATSLANPLRYSCQIHNIYPTILYENRFPKRNKRVQTFIRLGTISCNTFPVIFFNEK